MNSIYIYKKVERDRDYYNFIVAVDYADAKSFTRANSLYKLSKTPIYFQLANASQAVYRKIYELAKSGIKDFDEVDNNLVFGENIFAKRIESWMPFELINEVEQAIEIAIEGIIETRNRVRFCAMSEAQKEFNSELEKFK